ncbi:unnamed protein product [Caenorhabditis auriculariae]|uniref:G-protein coupled receptors family 1 profile domain-containing protein n=1 Tax=Caenorhabditis auriculariae TaxID=2777116 RepID=A0A8S1H745_9PELO|nr:unnamed protein product [Caenorhabditis auriculariae]
MAIIFAIFSSALANVFEGQAIMFIYIFTLTLQAVSWIVNGFVLVIFHKKPSMLLNLNHRLIFYLSLADWIFTMACAPQFVYMLIKWSPGRFDYNVEFVRLSSAPTAIEYKVNLTLTIAIALERCLAIYKPFWYRSHISARYANISIALGVFLGVFDCAVSRMLLRGEIPAADCDAPGCFTNPRYRYYSGVSSMCMGITVTMLTMAIIIKLNFHKDDNRHKDSWIIKQTNRVTTAILTSSFVFFTIPSILFGVSGMIGDDGVVFKQLGPFYVVGLLSSGICNGLIFATVNREARQVAKLVMIGIIESIKIKPKNKTCDRSRRQGIKAGLLREYSTFRRLLGIRTSSSKMHFSTVAFLLASTALLVSGSVIREKRQCGCAQQQSTCSCSQQVYTMTTAAPQRSCSCQSAPVQQTPSCGCAQPQTLQIQVPVTQCAPACQQSCQQSCQAAPSVPQCQQTCQQSCMPSCASATTPAPQIIQLQLDISAEASCQPACQQQCQQSCQAAPSVPQCQQSCQAACVPSCAPTTTPAPQVIQVQLDISAQATCQPACQQQCQQQCVQQQQPVAQCNSQCNNQCQSMCAPATTPAPSCQPACQPACQPQCTQQQQPQEIQIVLQTSVAQSPQCEPQCQQQCQQQCVQQQQPASHYQPAQVVCQPTPSSSCGCHQNYSPCGNGQCCRRK